MSDKPHEPDPAGETADEGGGTYGEVQPGKPVTPATFAALGAERRAAGLTAPRSG